MFIHKFCNFVVVFVANAFLNKVTEFLKKLGIGSLKDYSTSGFIVYHKYPEKMTIINIIIVTVSNMMSKSVLLLSCMPVLHVYPQICGNRVLF